MLVLTPRERLNYYLDNPTDCRLEYSSNSILIYSGIALMLEINFTNKCLYTESGNPYVIDLSDDEILYIKLKLL